MYEFIELVLKLLSRGCHKQEAGNKVDYEFKRLLIELWRLCLLRELRFYRSFECSILFCADRGSGGMKFVRILERWNDNIYILFIMIG